MSDMDRPTGTFDGSDPRPVTGLISESHGDLSVEDALLLDGACNTFESKWRGGGRPDIWAAVVELPEAIRPVALRELIQLDVYYRRKAGEAPTATDYSVRFTDLDPDWLASVVSRVGTKFEDTSSTGRASALSVGTVIAGRYTLVDVIGEGGMGTVYRANQTEPVKRQVALKLIKTGMDSKIVLARFNAERQALALMDHPNIARVYDGGTSSTGQPFFVMELVLGAPITAYCDRHRLPIQTRLELFVAVCQAVQHAHQKGIIHRDLKPGNILVAEVDRRPTPKVIDFGVAKATEFKLTDQTFADTGAIVGTPGKVSRKDEVSG